MAFHQGRAAEKTGLERRRAGGACRSPAAAGLVFLGLRKSTVVILLAAGCTDAEVAANAGQTRERVEHYARQVNRLKLAAGGPEMGGGRSGN